MVYGEARVENRNITWDLMRSLSFASTCPWLCIGDFNEVLRLDEYEGSSHRSLTQVTGFRDAVDVCGLNDLGFSGTK